MQKKALMILTSFQCKNLFSFKEANLNLEKRGLTLITGWNKDNDTANGAGKSAITSKGIVWTLYGRTISGLKGDDVSLKRSKGESYGQIFFQSNNKDYRITRYRNPSKLILEQFTDDWEEISCKTQAETQEKIDFLLKKDFQVFLHTDFFGQGMTNTFVSLSSSQQNTLFEFVIALDKVNELIDKAKFKKADIICKMDSLNNDVQSHRGSISEIGIQLNEAKQAQERIDKAKAEINTDKGIEVIEKELKESGLARQTIKDTLSKYETALNSLNSNLRILTTQKKEVKRYTCPTCEQPIEEELYKQLFNDQERLGLEINHTGVKINKLEEVVPLWRSKLEKENIKYQELDNVFNKLRILNEQSKTLNLDGLAERKEILQKELNELNKKLDKENEKFFIYSFWENAFKVDFRNFLIEKSCPFLETRANFHLRGMQQNQITIQFSTDKELKSGDHKVKFNVSISSKDGVEGYDLFSGGEQQFISFAVGLAFADLVSHVSGSDSNIMILDEPFMALDRSSAHKLVNYIREQLVKIKSSILLVSNEDSITDLIPNKIEVVKENGVSTIG